MPAGGLTNTRTMTDAQAWYAMILFLKRHIDTGWTIERLVDATDNLGFEQADRTPTSFSPGEWEEWV